MGAGPSTVSWLPIYPNGYIPRTAPLAAWASVGYRVHCPV